MRWFILMARAAWTALRGPRRIAKLAAQQEAERVDRIRNPHKWVSEYRNPERVSGK